MELKDSFLYSPHHGSCLCPEPDEFAQPLTILFLEGLFQYYPLIIADIFRGVKSSAPNLCVHLCTHPQLVTCPTYLTQPNFSLHKSGKSSDKPSYSQLLKKDSTEWSFMMRDAEEATIHLDILTFTIQSFYEWDLVLRYIREDMPHVSYKFFGVHPVLLYEYIYIYIYIYI
jgi:hypothetical protein